MIRKKRLWILNVVIVITILLCGLAFLVHAKNWIRFRNDEMRILSGIYYSKLPYATINDVEMVDRLPSMERLNGFSAWMKEKGVFRDSLHPDNKVYVYVDDLSHPKIRLVHHDSLVIYLNLADSLQTQQLYETLLARKDSVHQMISHKK